MSALMAPSTWLDDAALASYVMSQTCAPLQNEASVDVAVAALNEAGLPVHPDRPKNWDTFLALYHALLSARHDTPVLDAGAELYSAFLPSLRQLGWTSLTGVNLAFTGAQTRGGIAYEPGDITATRYRSGSFGYVACLSVIEHGVDVVDFLAEMARILRPGGRLFVSFDYWETPVPTDGLVAYDVPVRIFDRCDLQSIVHYAASCGLTLQQDAQAQCDDRVVYWRRTGLRYTFANLLFRRI